YSQVLYLTYFEGFSNSEAAKILDKNNRQIENLIYRAKQALKAQLEKEGFVYEKL
ncbi:MAG: RNA polymerase subunit sigma-24, partial [Ruminococcus sp.]|nr:RNA polymerase subunit sigma-24 [Ruminococcus sp.]